MQRISIVGCGWLGLPLGKHLVKQGYPVIGTTTRTEKLADLESQGIQGYQLIFQPDQLVGDVDQALQSDILILNVPPGRKDPEVAKNYPKKIAPLLGAVTKSSITKIILLSSTSVFGHATGTVNELTMPQPTTASGKALLEVEQMCQDTGLKLCILRLSGLVGNNRHPGRFLAGRTNIPNGDAPVNLVHREDIIQIIQRIIEKDHWGKTYNVSSDKHPPKRAMYEHASQQLGLEAPQFLDGGADGKAIDNQLVREELGYEFLYPDPMEMFT